MLLHEQKWIFRFSLSLSLCFFIKQALEINLWNSLVSRLIVRAAIEKDYREWWCIEILSNGKLMAKAIFITSTEIASRSGRDLLWSWSQAITNEKIMKKTTSTCFRKCQLFIECLHVSINYIKHSRAFQSVRTIIIETNKLTFQKCV